MAPGRGRRRTRRGGERKEEKDEREREKRDRQRRGVGWRAAATGSSRGSNADEGQDHARGAPVVGAPHTRRAARSTASAAPPTVPAARRHGAAQGCEGGGGGARSRQTRPRQCARGVVAHRPPARRRRTCQWMVSYQSTEGSIAIRGVGGPPRANGGSQAEQMIGQRVQNWRKEKRIIEGTANSPWVASRVFIR